MFRQGIGRGSRKGRKGRSSRGLIRVGQRVFSMAMSWEDCEA